MLTPYECATIQSASWRREHGWESWTQLETDKYDTEFFIHRMEDGEVIICFHPSNSIADWKINFSFFQKAYKNSNLTFFAHGGFLRAWKQVRDYIEEEVKKLEPTSITVTGYSYGGALAVLCMEDMSYLFPELKLHCITFGAPRVIWSHINWKKLKERWNNDFRKTIQFKNGSDIVPTVPLISFGFHHVGELTHIGKPIRWWRYLNPMKYHDLDNYKENIKKISGLE